MCELYDDIHQMSLAIGNVTPGIRAWLTYIGSDADVAVTAAAIVRKQFDDAKRELLKVADLEQGEAYELALSSLLMRWESDAGKQIVDWLIRYGITPEGKLAGRSSAAGAV